MSDLEARAIAAKEKKNSVTLPGLFDCLKFFRGRSIRRMESAQGPEGVPALKDIRGVILEAEKLAKQRE